MGPVILDEIQLTPLRRISVPGGDVLHALKRTDPGFHHFGEAYFSMIDPGAVKAWKLHQRMTLNLIVPVGEVRFVFYAPDAVTSREEVIGISRYARLTVPPGIWFGFQGLAPPFSLILNIASIPHDADEVMKKSPGEFNYNWRATP